MISLALLPDFVTSLAMLPLVLAAAWALARPR